MESVIQMGIEIKQNQIVRFKFARGLNEDHSYEHKSYTHDIKIQKMVFLFYESRWVFISSKSPLLEDIIFRLIIH